MRKKRQSPYYPAWAAGALQEVLAAAQHTVAQVGQLAVGQHHVAATVLMFEHVTCDGLALIREHGGRYTGVVLRMSKASELVANIDLDGTVANFNKGMLTILNETRNPIEPEYTSKELDNPAPWLEARMWYIKRHPGFWRNLEPIPLGLKVVKLIENAGFHLNVLTKGPKKTTSAWTEKADWAAIHLPDAHVTVTTDKGLVYGKVLFDDWPDYITRWLEWRPRGLVLMLDHPWNQGFEHQNVIRITGESSFPAVVAALQARAAS